MASSVCHLDFETFSTAPLRVCGAYHYAQHATTEVLCCCWAVDDESVRTWVPQFDEARAREFRFPRNQFWFYGPTVPEPLVEAIRSGMTVVAHNCVTPEHEVLTPDGWVRLDKLNGSELVAQVEPVSGDVTFTPYTHVVSPYSGTMFAWNSRYHKGVYTPNHRMYVNSWHDRSAQVKTAQEIVDGRMFDSSVLTAGHRMCAFESIALSPDEARFMEAIRSDANVEGEKENFGLRFSFKKDRKIIRLREFLQRFNVRHTEVEGDDGVTRFRIKRSHSVVNKLVTLLGVNNEYGSWVLRIPSDSQKALLREVAEWDSHTRGGRAQLSTIDEQTIQWLSTLAAVNGMSMRYGRESNARGFSKSDGFLYRGTLRKRDRAKIQYAPSEIEYIGNVYCVSVPTKAFLIRRDTTIWVTGNSQFERAIWQAVVVRRHGGPPIKRQQFVCTAARAAAANLPRSLDGVGMALGTQHQKDKEGARLLRMFAMPRKPTKKDERVRILPLQAPDEFRKLCDYCAADVRTERDVDKLIPPLHPDEQALYTFDMEINERGLLIDIPLVRKASGVLKRLERNIILDVQRRTTCEAWPEGLRPTQRDKMMGFFASIGVELENLQADHVRKYLKTNVTTLPTLARELLLLRIEAGKSSTKKFTSMLACTSKHDHRARGTLLFHGSSTGRWSGRLIQPQNFLRGTLKYEEQLRIFDLLRHADHEVMSMLYEWPISAIGSCMRGFILPSPGKIMRVVDYASIEARVLAWLADESWVLQAYIDGLDVYKLMASGVFNTSYEDVTSEQRRIGKNLVLGCGYGLGGAKFVAYSEKAGVEISEAFAKAAVKSYRTKHPKIISFWYDVERAAISAVRENRSLDQAVVLRNLKFYIDSQWLCIELPNGRCLRYYRPKVVPVEKFGQPSLQLQFKTEFRGRLVSESTYGGKLTENITQAVARDILVNGMYEADRNGYTVMGTVHDEILTEQYPHEGSVHELEQIVCRLPEWARGLPIAAEGFESYRYRKG